MIRLQRPRISDTEHPQNPAMSKSSEANPPVRKVNTTFGSNIFSGGRTNLVGSTVYRRFGVTLPDVERKRAVLSCHLLVVREQLRAGGATEAVNHLGASAFEPLRLLVSVVEYVASRARG
jgi:hypothetical protein